jgi:hypothetical protein
MVLHVVMDCVVMFCGVVRRIVMTRVAMTCLIVTRVLVNRMVWAMVHARGGRRSAGGDQTDGGQRKQQYFHG